MKTLGTATEERSQHSDDRGQGRCRLRYPRGCERISHDEEADHEIGEQNQTGTTGLYDEFGQVALEEPRAKEVIAAIERRI